MRCDLHVHSRFSTDSGNFALRRARLPESFTEPARVYHVARARGMGLVTLTDHNTLDGALRLGGLPGTFLSVEVTTRFPEDDVPLHVLVWNLTEGDHRDLQPYRPSVYELVAFLRERGLVHALAHPLYRMGPPITPAHVERMMLLFGIWEVRNGARSRRANELAVRLASAGTPAYFAKLAERHELEPQHDGAIVVTGGSDDHGALDIATTWTEAPGETPETFLAAVVAGAGTPGGAHGSTEKLAHAVGSLFLRAYRERSCLGSPLELELLRLFDEDADDPDARHEEIREAAGRGARLLAARALDGAGGLDQLPGLERRASLLALAGGVHLPYLAGAQHHAASNAGLRNLAAAFFGLPDASADPHALVFTDTFDETNGVAGTMRQLAEAGAGGRLAVAVVARSARSPHAGLRVLEADWTVPLPGYESIELCFPSPMAVLALVESEQPDVVHIATPGPIGACGLLAAKLLGIPVVGSWHTELAPYALHLTRDLLVSEALDRYVEWFYRACGLVLAPTRAVGRALEARGFADRVRLWGRGVDVDLFTPLRRRDDLRDELLEGGDLLLLSVGRVSHEKRLGVLLDAFGRLIAACPGARLAIAGDGPARERLEAEAPSGVRFLGELRGDELAAAYASADVFCFPSTTDTFGQVLLEAAASGLPTVAAAAGGAPELVRDRKTGLLVAPDDAEAFAAALVSLAASAELRRTLGAQARESALRWTWDRAFAQLAAAYRAAAAPEPAAVAQPALLPLG